MGNGMERRDFLKVIGAAGVGAGLSGCAGGKPERLLPYVVPQEEIIPGIATWYRTTCQECPAGCGMNIRTREGRAVKAEGNPFSPLSHGKLCARGQASLQGLYDPDRIPQALARAQGGDWQKITWDDAENRLVQGLQQARGAGVLLTRGTTGAMDRLLDDFASAAGLERVRHDAFGFEPLRAATRLLFGVDAVPTHDFSRAEVVVGFGADFLETWLSPVDYAHGFVQGHAYRNGQRGKLIAVTPHQSLTDLNADEWLPIRPGTEHLVALAMAKEIAGRAAGATGAATALLEGVDLEQVADASGVPATRIRAAAAEFARDGRSLAVGPGVASTHGAATAVAAAVAVLNSVAGNIGTTVRFDRTENTAAGRYADMQQLLQRLQGGRVRAVLVYGPNPAYSLPEGQAFRDALQKVPFVASFSSYLDETSELAHLLLPDHHFLESWGDVEPRTGVHSLVQPVLVPVFRTKQTGDVLLSVGRRASLTLPTQASTFYDYLREHWQREVFPQAGSGSFDDWWREALKQGTVVVAPTGGATSPSLDAGGLGQVDFAVPQLGSAGGTDDLTLIAYPSYRFYDGRTANRPWLQELPDPIGKISWGSFLEVSPALAQRLGLDLGSVVEVKTPNGTAELPVWPHPGMREDVIALQIGQGHRSFGRYARDRGVNAFALLAPQAERTSGALIHVQPGVTLRPTGDWARVANTAGRQTEAGRDVLKTVGLGEARSLQPVIGAIPAQQGQEVEPGAPSSAEEDVAAAEREALHPDEVHPLKSEVAQLQASGGFRPMTFGAGPQDYPSPETYYGEYTEAQPRWAMSIDLERCIGCSACMTACYAENNIGIVGPELVANGRILSWMRIERYFEEDDEGQLQRTGFLPMLCQQCGQAPCEPVCPVYAAYHTPDGLNGQVYNRCVGTRYCANNCPYKVRYYNWFSWEWPEPLNWQLNPDVQVREKGVMEKCSFCVQRIRDAEHTARLDGRAVADGEITPACAQTCPGEAIVFGNIKDPNSRVARVAASGRGYRVLEELNTQSAITYLKRVVTEVSEA